MEVNELLETLKGHAAYSNLAAEAHDTIVRLQAKLTALAPFMDAAGEPRKVLGRLPVTKDGCIIAPGAEVFWVVVEDPEYWGVKSAGDVIKQIVTTVMMGKAFKEYKGDFTIGTRDLECGNMELYSTREAAALAAKVREGGGEEAR